ncbi:gluconate 2-dehydrogenase subunit 3 family protein [Homoserinimonas sp. OAct 916]|uniref:gluconate 2-dehydrogenase subunit 3 family protein n=1 Tax=Homoserinimonas sp. OAct 916 TaxID=2211450 RepID=UPI000DBE4EDA|nr:gluconate 2-dehydrogenase subunit 3 family protein [Homoserinimonas sp. OAct 916]
MSTLPLDPRHGGGRFPDFDVTTQARHWDETTRAVVEKRLGMQTPVRFFTESEQAAATALFDQLLYQRSEPRVPVTEMVDARLAENLTDGWHYETMPPDEAAWRASLTNLDDDSREAHGCLFAECDWDDQSAILTAIQNRGSDQWHGMVAAQVWSLWTRYACTAFYSHPQAWNEIGFDGPAYPRGYKNIGVNRLESFEVHDARPGDDPVEGKGQ